jgi:hypothetical protein
MVDEPLRGVLSMEQSFKLKKKFEKQGVAWL